MIVVALIPLMTFMNDTPAFIVTLRFVTQSILRKAVKSRSCNVHFMFHEKM